MKGTVFNKKNRKRRVNNFYLSLLTKATWKFSLSNCLSKQTANPKVSTQDSLDSTEKSHILISLIGWNSFSIKANVDKLLKPSEFYLSFEGHSVNVVRTGQKAFGEDSKRRLLAFWRRLQTNLFQKTKRRDR